MFQLGNYFFSENDFDIDEGIQGETKRTRNGTIRTDISSDPFKTFYLELERISAKEHSHLLYLVNKMLPISDGGEELTFFSPYGNQYTVTIPAENGYDFSPQKGKEEKYNWELELWEVI
ncbi:MAG: hypothetical protein ACQEQF_01715 [Bacillota bacterium]